MNTSIVRFKGVEKRYPQFVLSDVSFDIPPGSIVGFVGPNGAGKSTTMRILMGLVHQDRGEVSVLGHAMPAEQAAAKWEIGFASEDMRLYGYATLAWHMQFIASIYPAWDTAYAEKLLQRFDLRAEQKIKRLSHGQRVKAMLLLVLARRPRLLVLDEPTTGLDPVARHELLGELMEVLDDTDRTILFSSHNTHDVERISDHIIFIDRGRIIDSRDKETFLERWKRLRIEVPEKVDLSMMPGVVDLSRSGRLAVVTVREAHSDTVAAYQQAGATVHAVENMTLEEIFVTNVELSRKEAGQ